MKVTKLKDKLPARLYESISRFETLLPSQSKAIEAGLLDNNKNILISTPTASGKTLIAEIAMMKSIFEKVGKAIYISPLKALASEKYNQFKELYGKDVKIALSIGDVDASNSYVSKADMILTTSEKLDSEIRHSKDWLRDVKVVIIDEIHLLNDPSRGPTLEIIITILKNILKNVKIVGLSATIGNPEQLAQWLNAELVVDNWRPVKLKKGILFEGKIEFYDRVHPE